MKTIDIDIISIINQLFTENKYKISGLVNYDLLITFSEYNDKKLSLSYNLESEMMHLYSNGFTAEFISKYNVVNDITPIDKNLYHTLINHILLAVDKDEEHIKDMMIQLKVLESREEYEKASVLHRAITKIKGAKYL